MNAQAIHCRVDDDGLAASAFVGLAQQVWPGNYSLTLIEEALRCTINITAWHGGELVGCVRILTDGYLFTTIPVPEHGGAQARQTYPAMPPPDITQCK